jgi:hypothetical protein
MEKQVEASEAMMAKQKEEMEDAYNKMEEEAEKAAGKVRLTLGDTWQEDEGGGAGRTRPGGLTRGARQAREAERKHQEVMDLQQKLAQMEQQLALAHATRTTPKAADLGDSLDVVRAPAPSRAPLAAALACGCAALRSARGAHRADTPTCTALPASAFLGARNRRALALSHPPPRAAG